MIQNKISSRLQCTTRTEQGTTFEYLPLVDLETVTERYPPEEHGFSVALSFAKKTRLRAEKCAQATKKGYRLVSYVSSRCTNLTDYPMGENCFILEDNTIQPFVRIGNNVTIWSDNHIGHHSYNSDHCFITSHVVVSGPVRIEPYCFFGVNATLRDGIIIARETLVGAGGNIMKALRMRSYELFSVNMRHLS